MPQILCFSNPGEIDPRMASTLGVNVKDSDSPIGYFGTGLKYAIAVALRMGNRVSIQSGLAEYEFSAKPETIRGKEFQVIHMAGQEGLERLGFTTEYGKNWQPWMAYRELWSNAKDEGGSDAILPAKPTPTAGETRVLVSGSLVEEFHRKSEWLMDRPALETNALVSIHRGLGLRMFYRGIRVADMDQPGIFTYNVQAQLALTEDRTASFWHLHPIVSKAVPLHVKDKGMLREILLAPREKFESRLNFDGYVHEAPSAKFAEVVAELYDNHSATLNQSAVRLCQAHGFRREPASVTLTVVEEKMLARARLFLTRLGHDVTERVVVVESLGSQGLCGLAKDGVIWLPKSTFGKGTKFVASTLLEEHLHCSLGLDDCSRGLQDWLFDRVVSLGEELAGEPL